MASLPKPAYVRAWPPKLHEVAELRELIAKSPTPANARPGMPVTLPPRSVSEAEFPSSMADTPAPADRGGAGRTPIGGDAEGVGVRGVAVVAGVDAGARRGGDDVSRGPAAADDRSEVAADEIREGGAQAGQRRAGPREDRRGTGRRPDQAHEAGAGQDPTAQDGAGHPDDPHPVARGGGVGRVQAPWGRVAPEAGPGVCWTVCCHGGESPPRSPESPSPPLGPATLGGNSMLVKWKTLRKSTRCRRPCRPGNTAPRDRPPRPRRRAGTRCPPFVQSG